MTLNRTRVRALLASGNYRELFFEELGWDAAELPAPTVRVEGARSYTLTPLAQKRGVYAFLLVQTPLPVYAERRAIETELVKRFREHFIIFAEPGYDVQVWQWVLREPGRTAGRAHELRRGQAGEALLQKLERLAFTLAQEPGLGFVDVVGSVQAAFNVERATRAFFTEFKDERNAFAKFLDGIPDDELEAWYVSVMLNRLMFIYFIQKKGFLDGDVDYLRHRLAESRRTGADRFYREVLCPLFFEGFATPHARRSPAIAARLGAVPYLNGGIFAPHEVEKRHGQRIQIADRAFDRLFSFFERYQWHLDDRPLHNDTEINPDVLGYIFEKYINQRQMGAYYTQEDITEYISKQTILPYLLDAVQRSHPAAFRGEQSVWRLVQRDPDRYIYEALRKGVTLDLPPAIAAGIDDVAQRSGWNTPTPEAYALPTELWRETVARRQRYQALRARLAAGAVQHSDDFITANLDLRQFVQDVLQGCEDPDLLRACWRALRTLAVIDPTCGSAAFLFAALNILEPLYEACVERMEHFVASLPPTAHAEKFKDMRQVLAEMARHPNPRYFITKSIIVNNLYGVDIMHEAVEIAKLRLFLRLAALVELDAAQPNLGIEPLPDIDFNIRAGNTLVGFATREEVERALRRGSDQQEKLLLLPEEDDALARIEEQAAAVDRLYTHFRALTTGQEGAGDADDTAATKTEVQRRLDALRGELDRLLAIQYGVDPDSLIEYPAWLASHQPFHWFVEFYGTLHAGGFHVIIGNPPWKEYAAVRKQYRVLNYVTESTGNLYALCIERAMAIRSAFSRFSFIVQLPLVNSSRMETVRNLLSKDSDLLWVVPFDDRPGKLFNGLQHCRSSIFISATGAKCKQDECIFVTRYQRWYTEARSTLFDNLDFVRLKNALHIFDDQYPKFADSEFESVMANALRASSQNIGTKRSAKPTKHFIFYQEATQYWVKATVGLPYYDKNGVVSAPAHGRYLYWDSAEQAYAVCALMHSSLFYLFFVTFGDCFHLSQTLCDAFPLPEGLLADPQLALLGKALMRDLEQNAGRATIQTKDGNAITYAEFYGSKSKHLIDQIDKVLAQHFGFTAEEVDAVMNYDVKFRMGDELNGEDGEE